MPSEAAQVLEIKKRCLQCEELRTRDQYWPEKRHKDGLASTCKICTNKRRNELFAASHEKRKEKYIRQVRNKNPELENLSHHTCTKCKIDKPRSEFFKDKVTNSGVNRRCKVCMKKYWCDRYYNNEENRRRIIKGVTDSNRRRKYGITPEEFIQRLHSQNNGCAICSKILDESKRSLVGHVDHCHATGKIRGILCSNCNTGLGVFQDNEEFLKNAINYLLISKLI